MRLSILRQASALPSLTGVLTFAGLLAAALAGGCSTSPPSDAARSDSATAQGVSTVVNGKLWVLNRSGNPSLADYFTCLLNESTWNQLATQYPYPESLTFGSEAFVSGATCNPGGPEDQGAFQCAVNAGHFNVSPFDVVLVIRDDTSAGGQNNSTGAISVRNPVNGANVRINSAEIGNGTRFGTEDYLYVYAGHEVFESQTDGVSGDCCDGETAYGGSFNWCSACGGPSGGCGQHQGDLGITHIACPSGHTYPYQKMSPPGAYAYGSPEFNGTCESFTVKAGTGPCAHVPGSGNGVYCGSSTQDGFSGGSPTETYDCQNGQVASTTACPFGCFIAPAGKADGCAADPCAGVPGSGNGAYCGSSTQDGFKGGNARLVYDCQNGHTAGVTTCGGSCVVAPAGQADHC